MIRLMIFVGGLMMLVAVQAQEAPKRVLFVGNSFIYFYNLPQVVSAMARESGSSLITRQSTVGGSSLEDHWNNLKGTRTMDLLKSEKWDYVVFNNHSLSAIESPENFLEYGKEFAQLVKDLGARPVFMVTWGYRSNPLMQKAITEGYEKLAEESEADLVYAGPLLAQARRWRPDLVLFHDDKHLNENGTYLIALAFHQFFTGEEVEGLPHRITTIDRDGELLYLLFLLPENATFLQQLAEEFEPETNTQ